MSIWSTLGKIGEVVANPLGSIASSLISGLTGNSAQASANEANLQAARETNEANKEIHAADNAFNAEQAQIAREWDTPAAKRKRLEEAGYNPMTFGEAANTGVSASSASAIPMTTGAPVQPVTAMSNALGNMNLDISGGLNALKEREQVSSNIESQRLERKLALEDNIRKWTEVYNRAENDAVQRKLIRVNIERAQNEMKYLDRKEESNLRLADAEYAARIEQIQSEKIHRDLMAAGIKASEAEVHVKFAQVKTLLAQAYQAYQQGDEAKSRKMLNDLQYRFEHTVFGDKVATTKEQRYLANMMVKNAVEDFYNNPWRHDFNEWNSSSFRNMGDVNEFLDLVQKTLNLANPLSPLAGSLK